MNLFMLFATWAANFVRVIGRRCLLKSMIGIHDRLEFDANQTCTAGLTFDGQGEHPTGWKGISVNTADGICEPNVSLVISG